MNYEHQITICLGSSCFSRGNKAILEIVKDYLRQHQLEQKVFFNGELCTGLCEYGPVIKVDDRVYKSVSSDNIYDILNECFGIE
ncbi:NAD(P)H-dependent oxidoreductase subunit E [Alkaliflexus imshenetskii]|jgi:NADH:ubiquinone oxidoreductase subunit E|uniref:NAD(P)H-dependent oxidoreductase subunit E n=1 Tax=Alkaliflexus imshenetskii TaxID=286730 RepID=UPI00047EC36A|nr:NAD(P)H-dependent oxidoreductase subunit E [Alkaliflexus imshenetskii]